MMKTPLASIVFILTVGVGLHATPADRSPVIELKNLRADRSVFADATRIEPIVLKSSTHGESYFGEEALATIAKAVDFEKQVVLVFAWHGSGQDDLAFAQSQSHPGRIEFTYKPGRTRDRRPHVKVFVLSSDVKWSAK